MKRLVFVVMLVASLISKGTCQCGPKYLSVSQEETGKTYESTYTEYRVTVTNQCNCDQREIMFACRGFQSHTNLDPGLFMKEHDVCVLQSGHSLSAKASVSFTYAWTQQSHLIPLFSQPSC